MSYVTNLALWLQYFNKLTYLTTNANYNTTIRRRLIFDTTLTFDPSDFEKLFSMMNICDKYHLNPSTK